MINLIFGVAVHQAQILPAVLIVVDPAQARAHQRRRVGKDGGAERAVLEVQPHLGSDVGEL